MREPSSRSIAKRTSSLPSNVPRLAVSPPPTSMRMRQPTHSRPVCGPRSESSTTRTMPVAFAMSPSAVVSLISAARRSLR
jgi:hypothetical protein